MSNRDRWHWCHECYTVTNHATQQHIDAMRMMCRECEEVEVKDEDRLCHECAQAEGEYLSELASYYYPDEDKGGQG